jgi:hypothetical protein
MEDNFEVKNIYGFATSIVLLFTLFLPICNDGVASFSLLSFNYGKVLSLLLIGVCGIFFLGLKRVYLKIVTLVVYIVLISQIVIIVANEEFTTNISTLSLIMIFMVFLFYCSFKAKYKS